MDCYYESVACQEIVSAMPMFLLVWLFSALMMLFCMYKWFSLELNSRQKSITETAFESYLTNSGADSVERKEVKQILKKLKLDK